MSCRWLVIAAAMLFASGCQRASEPAAAPAPAQALPAPGAAAPAASTGGNRVSGLPDFSPLVEKQGPAVVNVVTTTRRARTPTAAPAPGGPQADDPLLEFFRRFMPDAPQEAPPDMRGQGLGSGFIISSDGYVLTNAHVVANSDEVTVRLSDAKREFKAKVVGIDRRTDVALLKVEATGLPTVTLGNSANLKVGEWVAAIGSPFGFANTITAGIVSAKGRTLPDESFVPFIQTDVAVNPGNSGGPLLNLNGEVVGINSLIYSRTGGYMGVSFAIPIEVALDVGKQLQTTGHVTRGRLGVRIQELTKELAKSFNLEQATGVLVAAVDPNSPAQKAGLQPGDVLLKFNGKPIDSADELPRQVAANKPGTTVTLEVWRNGARQEVQVTLGAFPEEKQAVAEAKPAPASPPNRLGLVVSELPPAQRKMLGVNAGLVVERVEGAPGATPLRRGDVLLALNQMPLTSVDQFNQLLSKQTPGNSVALLVRRGDDTLYIPLQVATG